MPTITGTAGADTLTSIGTDDFIDGGAGNDTIDGGQGLDTILAGDGDDRIVFARFSESPGATIDGGAGFDSIDISSHNPSTYFFSRTLDVRTAAQPGVIEIEMSGYQRFTPGFSVVVATASNVEKFIGGLGTSFSLGALTTAIQIDARAGSRVTTGSGDDLVSIDRPTSIYSSSTLDGGAGTDTLVLRGQAYDFLFRETATGWTIHDTSGARHEVTNFEQVRFLDGSPMSFGEAASADFDAAGYLARYADLRAAFGTDEAKAYDHWQLSGKAEGRIGAFDGLSYIASYRDLINAYGPNASAGAYHYMVAGMAEGRIVSFDPGAYAASNIDLARIIGTDAARAASHYITNGVNEGRATAGFDSVAYLLSNPDLAGMTPAQARTHWLTSGADDGRVGDALFGREQTAFNFTGSSVTSQFETATDKDWFAIALPVYQSITFNGSAGVTGLAVYNATGRLIASDADGRDFRFFISNSDGAYGPAPYYLVASGGAVGSYTVTVTTQPLNAAPAEETHAAQMAADAGAKAATDAYTQIDTDMVLAEGSDATADGPAAPGWHDVTTLLA